MRIGVIGCGGMGTTHYLSLKVLSEKEDDVEVVALSDCRKEFLDKAASYFPEAATYEYGMELIEKEQLDIVHICLPSYLHAEHAVKALEKGMNVLVEKPVYEEVLVACKAIVEKCKENGQNFLFETGQETPVTLKRAIQDIEKAVGKGNVGINLDPANLIMYGKANPVDALEVFGEYVMGIHGKDGKYPTDGHHLGDEVPLGQGKVNYSAFIAKLKEIGYQGDITIEREISGEEQKKDIRMAKELLDKLIAE